MLALLRQSGNCMSDNLETNGIIHPVPSRFLQSADIEGAAVEKAK